MLHTETVLPSTLDLLKEIQNLQEVFVSEFAFALRGLTYFEDAEDDPMPEMLLPMTWNEVKQKIESVVRVFEKTF